MDLSSSTSPSSRAGPLSLSSFAFLYASYSAFSVSWTAKSPSSSARYWSFSPSTDCASSAWCFDWALSSAFSLLRDSCAACRLCSSCSSDACFSSRPWDALVLSSNADRSASSSASTCWLWADNSLSRPDTSSASMSFSTCSAWSSSCTLADKDRKCSSSLLSWPNLLSVLTPSSSISLFSFSIKASFSFMLLFISSLSVNIGPSCCSSSAIVSCSPSEPEAAPLKVSASAVNASTCCDSSASACTRAAIRV
mmetsp:Transcript_35100/g.76082  ORF Transcript_35100/g.76082 Transcript_35100/m.76082 type:complete len:252 (+) Transcript_35100:355-1110(+)